MKTPESLPGGTRPPTMNNQFFPSASKNTDVSGTNTSFCVDVVRKTAIDESTETLNQFIFEKDSLREDYDHRAKCARRHPRRVKKPKKVKSYGPQSGTFSADDGPEEVADPLQNMDAKSSKYFFRGDANPQFVVPQQFKAAHESFMDVFKEYYTPQSGYIFPGFRNFDAIIDKVEGACLICYAVSDCKTISGMVAVFMLYIKSLVSGSILEHIKLHFEGMMKGFTPQLGYEDVTSALDGLMTDWQALTASPIFTYFSRILSMSVALGLCSATNLKISWKEIDIFAIEARKQQTTALDLWDAVIRTVHFFLTAGVEAIRSCSLRPFLFANTRLQKVDEVYYQVLGAMRALGSGNLASTEIKSEDALYTAIEFLISELSELKQTEKRDQYAMRLIEVRLGRAQEWRVEFRTAKKGGDLRPAPYTFLIWGRSGVGKSTICQKLITDLLCDNGFDHRDPRKVIVIHPDDKFISNARSDALAYVFDDMGASAPNTIETNYARKWLDMSNNIANYAPKASVEEKGNCVYNHKIQVGTSNSSDGGMSNLTTYPVAVARRGTHDHIVLKEEFKRADGLIDGEKVKATFGNDRYPDIYEITVEKAVEHPVNQGAYELVVDTFQPPPIKIGKDGVEVPVAPVVMSKVSFATYYSYHACKAREHFASQNKLVDELKNAPKNIAYCEQHKSCNTRCGCYKTQSGYELCSYVGNFVTDAIVQRVKRRSGDELFNIAIALVAKFGTKLKPIHLLPDSIYYSQPFQWLLMSSVNKAISCSLLYYEGYFFWPLVVCSLMGVLFYSWWYIVPFSVLWYFYYIMRQVYVRLATNIAVHALEVSRRGLRSLYTESRARIFSLFTGGVAILGFCAILYQLLSLRKKYSPQGNISPICAQDVADRDKEVNPWATVSIKSVKAPQASINSSVPHLTNLISTNQLYVTVEDGGRRAYSNALVLETGVCALPAHMLFSDTREYIFQRKAPDVAGASFKGRFCKADAVLVRDTDIALVRISGGSFKNITGYISLESASQGNAVLIYKTKTGELLPQTAFRYNEGSIACLGIAGGTLRGYKYDLSYTTFEGLCAGTLINYNRQPTIIGLHSCGVNGTKKGGASRLLMDAYIQAREELARRFQGSTLQVPDISDVPVEQYSIQYFVSETAIDPKSPVNFIDPREGVTSFDVYGTVKGRSRYYSEVEKSPIADHISDVFGTPNIYGPPAFNRGNHIWREFLLKAAAPSPGCSQTLLERAAQDYLAPFPDAIKNIIEATPTGPLSLAATVNGIDGLRFIDRMKPSTSMGYPINKPKSDFLTESMGDNMVNFDFPPSVWTQFEKDKKTYLSGKRAYPIFRACLKDEVKKKTSQKVRVFQAAPISLQMLVRQYFLPVARVVSLLPLVSECAVGINAHSGEWDALMRHIRKFGDSRFIAGDYSSYDTRMPAQFTLAAFNVLIEIAKMLGGYTEDDFTIMRGIAADVAYPIVAFNGDLIGLFGSNPSGQNLTVYINSIVNSLYARVCFFSAHPEKNNFRAHIAATTYGDDIVAGVAETAPKFTFQSVQATLRDMDIGFTTPDKQDTTHPYVAFNEVDFLKRKSAFFAPLGHEVGVLSEDSIMKSLFCCLRSKSVLPGVQCAGAMDSALHEWFYHGEEIFEDRRAKFQEIYNRSGFRPASLDLSFQDRVDLLLKGD